MKKKSMMLGGLLAAVVVTAYSVSGTYAKYISSVDLTDEARVAKWGFTVTDKDGNAISENKVDLFANSYSKETDGNKTVYVESLHDDKVVAPGTKGEYTFKLAGEMETRYMLNFSIKAANDFVVYYTIENGELKMSKTAVEGYKEYRPLSYTVLYTRDGQPVGDTTKTAGKSAKELETVLNAYNEADATKAGFAPGEMNQQYTISWQWDTVNTVDGLTDDQVNELDTFAGQNLSATTDKVVFEINVTAEQVAVDHSEDSNN